MFKTNYTLIENISNEFNIDKNEINIIIKELFDKITLSIINGNKFYMDASENEYFRCIRICVVTEMNQI